MAWLDETDFRAIYVTDSASEVKSAQIDECLNSAKSQIKKRILADVFTMLSASLPTSIETVDDVRRAQGKIAYAELLLIQSARYRSGGILQQERDMNSSATDTYESYSATERRADRLKAEAFDILEIYYTPGETVKESASIFSPSAVRVAVGSDW